tara:strand:+ start:263 stop:403 length:141 start_codon:yes stop_codon:yes gene_type:complete
MTQATTTSKARIEKFRFGTTKSVRVGSRALRRKKERELAKQQRRSK